jgi:hypothetical protein
LIKVKQYHEANHNNSKGNKDKVNTS